MRERLSVSQESAFDPKAALASILVAGMLYYLHLASQPEKLDATTEASFHNSTAEIVKSMPAFWQQHFQVK